VEEQKMEINQKKALRLKNLFETRYFGLAKEFAKDTDIDPVSLSKIMNGKRPLSRNYAKKAAAVLDVTPEYLLCESDDSTPPRFQGWNISNEMAECNKQQYRFAPYKSFLEALGLNITLKALIGNKTYLFGSNVWIDTEGNDDVDYDDQWIKDKIRRNPGSQVIVELTYRDEHKVMPYEDYMRWMCSNVAMSELMLQKDFNVVPDLTLKVADNDTIRALKGEEPLKWQ